MTDSIISELFELGDEKYKQFQIKLIPTVQSERMIGVRTPALRSYAAKIYGSAEAEDFMLQLPHTYFDENNLHAFLIERIKDYDACINALDAFLPYIDNWATCDQMRPRCFSKYPDGLSDKIKQWIDSGKTYAVRFGIEMLMSFYLKEHFKPEYHSIVAGVKSDEYYVKMMVAWYFATALAHRPDDTLVYLEQKRLDDWTHNKAIRKAIESYRITDEQKAYLRTLTVK